MGVGKNSALRGQGASRRRAGTDRRNFRKAVLDQLSEALHMPVCQQNLSAHDRGALRAALAPIEAELNKRYASPAPSP